MCVCVMEVILNVLLMIAVAFERFVAADMESSMWKVAKSYKALPLNCNYYDFSLILSSIHISFGICQQNSV